jgi:hypothetical protein
MDGAAPAWKFELTLVSIRLTSDRSRDERTLGRVRKEFGETPPILFPPLRASSGENAHAMLVP